MTHFAVIEDNSSTNNAFKRLLQDAYPASTVRQFLTFDDAKRGLATEHFDLALLDIELGESPDERVGGFALAPLLKENRTPVIIISGTPPQMLYKHIMTTLFAWDYLEKPVDESELLAQVREVLAHVESAQAQGSDQKGSTHDPDLFITPFGRHRVMWKNSVVMASITHMKILKLLVDNHDQLVPYADLLRLHPSSRALQTLRVHINQIRDNFRDVDKEFDRIDTLTARGYIWRTISNRD